MSIEKEFLIKQEDYRRIILKKLYEIDAIRKCSFCGMEYLTGKDEPFIYAIVTNVFKKEFEDNYDNSLMKNIIKEILSERFLGHNCDK